MLQGINIALRSVTRYLDKARHGILYLDIAYGMVKDCARFLAGNIGGAANANHTVPAVSLLTQVDTSSAYPSYVSAARGGPEVVSDGVGEEGGTEPEGVWGFLFKHQALLSFVFPRALSWHPPCECIPTRMHACIPT